MGLIAAHSTGLTVPKRNNYDSRKRLVMKEISLSYRHGILLMEGISLVIKL
jgi:hypothetical protein